MLVIGSLIMRRTGNMFEVMISRPILVVGTSRQHPPAPGDFGSGEAQSRRRVRADKNGGGRRLEGVWVELVAIVLSMLLVL